MQLVEPLTPREREILALLASGATNQRIADELVVTVDTVKKHVSHVLSKLGAGNRTEAVARGRELGVIDAGQLTVATRSSKARLSESGRDVAPFHDRLARRAELLRQRGQRVEVEAVERGRVLADHLGDLVLGNAFEGVRERLGGVRESAFLVGEIAAPHDAVDAYRVALQAVAAGHEAGADPDVRGDVFTRRLRRCTCADASGSSPTLPASSLPWMWSIAATTFGTQPSPASAMTMRISGKRSKTPDMTSDQTGRWE